MARLKFRRIALRVALMTSLTSLTFLLAASAQTAKPNGFQTITFNTGTLAGIAAAVGTIGGIWIKYREVSAPRENKEIEANSSNAAREWDFLQADRKRLQEISDAQLAETRKRSDMLEARIAAIEVERDNLRHRAEKAEYAMFNMQYKVKDLQYRLGVLQEAYKDLQATINNG